MTVGENKPKVIVIPAVPKNTGPAEHRQLRVAAYCRVSTKEEDQLNSYEAQKNYYTDKIMENKSWTMADIFADEGITGTSAKKRETDLVRIRSILPCLHHFIIRMKSARFLAEVPVMPSSAKMSAIVHDLFSMILSV